MVVSETVVGVEVRLEVGVGGLGELIAELRIEMYEYER